jgi:pimeloyl-ACP methyl ester carboxylesterase
VTDPTAVYENEDTVPDPILLTGVRRPWWRRWGRRLTVTVLVLFVAVTIASFSYNAATAGTVPPPSGLRYVQAGDVHTRYREWGSTGSPIVLVPGAAETADTWSRLAPLLARDHRVYAYDASGFGYSQPRAPFTAAHQAEQLIGLVNALHLSKPILVGHSLGAAIVAEATLRQPTMPGGVLFLDGDALVFHPPAVVSHLIIDPYRTSVFRLGLRSDWVIRAIYSRQCAPGCPALDEAGVDQWRRPFQQPGAEAALWSMMRAGMAGVSETRLSQLRAVPVPKAVVFGGADLSTFTKDSPYQTAQRIGAPPPTIIPGAHHLTMISSPTAVATAIQSLTKH